MRFLFVGGSNFFMKGSVVESLPQYVAESTNEVVEEVVNISVPGTGCMCGVDNFYRLDDTDRFDLVFVEYAINDHSFFDRNAYLWELTFSSLLSSLKQRCPKAIIVVLLLGRKDQPFHAKQARLHKATRRVAADIGAILVDIDGFFKSKTNNFRSVYLDGVHYKTPFITNVIAALCALAVTGHQVQLLRGGGEDTEQIAYKPSSVFDVMDFSETVADGYARQPFANSKYSVNTVSLRAGEMIEMQTDGIPVGISFVSSYPTGSVLVEIDDQKAILHCMNRRVLTKEFAFLLRHFPFFWLPADFLRAKKGQKTDFRIRLIDGAEADWNEKLVKPYWSMVPVPQGHAKSANLLGLTLMR